MNTYARMLRKMIMIFGLLSIALLLYLINHLPLN